MGSMDDTSHRQWADDLSRRATGSDNQYRRPKSKAELEYLLNEGLQAGDARTEVIDDD